MMYAPTATATLTPWKATAAFAEEMRQAGYELRIEKDTRGALKVQIFRNVSKDGEAATVAFGAPIEISYSRRGDNDALLLQKIKQQLAKAEPAPEKGKLPVFDARIDIGRFLKKQETAPDGVASIVAHAATLRPGSRSTEGESSHTTRQLLLEGREMLFADTLVRGLAKDAAKLGVPIAAKDLEAIRVPLLHTLMKIHHADPGYLADLTTRSPAMAKRFALGVATVLLKEREALESLPIMEKGTRVLCGYRDPAFLRESDVHKMVEKFGVDKKDVSFFRGHPENDTKAVAQLMTKLKASVPDSTSPLVVLLHGGGSGDSIFIGGKNGDPNIFRPRDVAKALLDSSKGKSVDLGHVRFILDAAKGYNFSQQLLRCLDEQSTKAGRTISAMPVVVTTSGRGASSFAHTTTDESIFLRELRTYNPKESGKLTIGDVYAIDTTLSVAAARLIRGNFNADGRIVGQDPSVSGPALIPVKRMFDEIHALPFMKGTKLPLPTRSIRGTVPAEVSELREPVEGRLGGEKRV